MSQILTNATDAELGVAIEENLFAFFRAASAIAGGSLYEHETMSMHDACQSAALFKGVWRTRLKPEQMDAAIAEAQDWFRKRGLEFMAWWFSSRQTQELFKRLEAHGFALDYSAPGMALDMTTLGERLALPAGLTLPDGLTITEARDAQTLADFSTVIFESYKDHGMSLEAARAFERATLALGIYDAPWRLYVGYVDDKPVATNLAFDGGGVTGLFCIATVPECRGRGIGAAITLAPLYETRDAGYQYAVLFASESGLRVYERTGFREVGMSIGRYMWYDE